MPLPTVDKPKTVQPKKSDTPMTYPEVMSFVRTVGSELGPITAEEMKGILGWEDEDTYKQRQTDKKKAAIGFGEEFLLKDPAGHKVRCWYNTRNRPFGLQWSKQLAQVLLHSGPNLPDEQREWQFNGEALVLGQYAQVLSGQHRGIALILAVYEWRKNKEYWMEHGGWDVEPYLETILTVGIDESPKTTRTMDNVKPRSLSDVFYTSGIFDKLKQTQREECSKMLQTAINFLWKRTGVSEDEAHKFQTHGESVAFYDRHPKLLECIEHIYKLNSGETGRQVTALKLQPGLAAGMLYLMGASNSDPDEYLSGIHARSEKALNWDNWDQACDFWTALAAGAETMAPVREVLGNLVDPDHGEGGRTIEKVGVICKAWNLYLEGAEFAEGDISLEYLKDDTTGELALVVDKDFPNFRGMDGGEPVIAKEPGQTKITDMKEEIKQKNLEAMKDAPKPVTTTKANGVHNGTNEKARLLMSIKEQHPGKVIMFGGKGGTALFWGNDATFVAKLTGNKSEKDATSKLDLVIIQKDEVDTVTMRLLAAKCRLAKCDKDGKVTDIVANKIGGK
jgi:hypothetical protein